MKISEKVFAVATGIIAFTTVAFPKTFELGLAILVLGAAIIFILSHKSIFGQWPSGGLSVWPGSEDEPETTAKQFGARWAAIGIAVCIGAISGYLAHVFIF
jgi:hypothetical protein